MKVKQGSALTVIVGLVVLGLQPAARADSLVISATPGTQQNTDGITGFATDGDGMVGMQVTAFFEGGTSQTVSWQATSTIAGVAQGTGWSLSESGDTFGGDWVLTNVSAAPITGFLIDGGPGRTVFDINPGSPSTANSASGQPFTRVGGSTGRDIAVVYSDALGVGGNAPVGDLYRKMDVKFNAPGGPIQPGSQSLVFETDTDNATTDIVPEPSAVLLAFGALGVLSLRGRRATRDR